MAATKKRKETKKTSTYTCITGTYQRHKSTRSISGICSRCCSSRCSGSIDPYLSRNEFKEGFYDQPKPPVSYETLKGTAAKQIPNITDTESFADGGSVRGQKNIQVKKKPFRGVF
jgi:hypothetical protein